MWETEDWILSDIRLGVYDTPYEYSASPDALHSSYQPTTPEEAEFVKSRLKEYIEDEHGTLHWCTFASIVRRHAPLSDAPWGFSACGYFTREEGEYKLQEIKAFWDKDATPLHGKMHSAEVPRIFNPHFQPSASAIVRRVVLKKYLMNTIKI